MYNEKRAVSPSYLPRLKLSLSTGVRYADRISRRHYAYRQASAMRTTLKPVVSWDMRLLARLKLNLRRLKPVVSWRHLLFARSSAGFL